MRSIVAYIATDNPDAAERFVPALEETFAQLEALPGLGSVRHFGRTDLQGVRIIPVTGFAHYLLFYRLCDSNRTILAAKELRHIAQTLVRHLINPRFDATLS